MPDGLYDIVIASVLLLVFGLCTRYCIKMRCDKLTDALHSGKTLTIHLIKMIIGIVLFGIIPFLQTGNSYNYLQIPILPNDIMGILIALLTCIVVLSLSSAQQQAPISVNYSITNAAMHLYLPARILFLISYEIFFRGNLLFAAAELWGSLIAVIINVTLYTLLHAGSGKKEFIGAIPFGLILCIITFKTSSVWPAVILHIFLALPFEIAVIRKSILKQKKSI